MLFTSFMSRRKIYSLGIVLVVVFAIWFFQESNGTKEDFSEVVKVSLRDVGNQLLLFNQDSTSLVLPVIELEESKFELSFQSSLSFEPGVLVSAVKNAFLRADLPENYIVEVIQCVDEEVAYSYQMSTEEQTTIIPCVGRILPQGCYSIEVNFTKTAGKLLGKNTSLYFVVLVCLVLIIFSLYKRKTEAKENQTDKECKTIGSFQFYPEQNKLVKSATEIGLSRKECELLTIFVANANQVVKRDELTKRVWEDNGVIVGRSLDTYISKLRTKLKDDDSIKLTNVHGVGYKLEVSSI